MTRIVILGSTGMLGSEVLRVAKKSGIEHLAISRSTEISFDAKQSSVEQLAMEVHLNENDWLVNCIGWIPQKSSGDIKKDSAQAELLNTSLPEQLSEAKSQFGFNWIQIGTDCVFEGNTGRYSEDDVMDATDLYGQSKIAGEQKSEGVILIRSSIVGRDQRTSSGIYSWFKQAISGGPVSGYSNQVWNGVSTTAFAKLSVGLAKASWTEPLLQHWIPEDSVSKYELLSLFAKELGLDEGLVLPVDTAPSVDRTLTTTNRSRNNELWGMAGYKPPPSIAMLCKEFIAIDQKLG